MDKVKTIWEKAKIYSTRSWQIGRQPQNNMLHSLKFSFSCKLSKKQPHCLFPVVWFVEGIIFVHEVRCWGTALFFQYFGSLYFGVTLPPRGRCPCGGLAIKRRAIVRQPSKQTPYLEIHCLNKDEEGLLPGVSWEPSLRQVKPTELSDVV